MSLQYEESVLDFDLGFFNQSPKKVEISGNATSDVSTKYRKSVSLVKKKIIATDSLIRKYYDKKEELGQLEKALYTSKEDCKKACIDYRTVTEKCTVLQNEIQILQNSNQALQEKCVRAENQVSAMQSYANQLQSLIKENETVIEGMKVESQLEKANSKDNEKSKTTYQCENELLKKHLCIMRNVILKKKKVNKKIREILLKYNSYEGDDNDSLFGGSNDDELDHDDQFNSLMLLDETSKHETHWPLSKTGHLGIHEKIRVEFADTKGDQDIDSDTGRGSSLAFSDGEKCFPSPDYFVNHSPMNTEICKVKVVDIATSPIPSHFTDDLISTPKSQKKYVHVATSPIFDNEVITTTDLKIDDLSEIFNNIPDDSIVNTEVVDRIGELVEPLISVKKIIENNEVIEANNINRNCDLIEPFVSVKEIVQKETNTVSSVGNLAKPLISVKKIVENEEINETNKVNKTSDLVKPFVSDKKIVENEEINETNNIIRTSDLIEHLELDKKIVGNEKTNKTNSINRTSDLVASLVSDKKMVENEINETNNINITRDLVESLVSNIDKEVINETNTANRFGNLVDPLVKKILRHDTNDVSSITETSVMRLGKDTPVSCNTDTEKDLGITVNSVNDINCLNDKYAVLNINRIEKECLENNNSEKLNENSLDGEIEMILRKMRFDRQLITPLPSTPSKSRNSSVICESFNKNSCINNQIPESVLVCKDALKVREENKVLQSNLALLAKEIEKIKAMLTNNHISHRQSVLEVDSIIHSDYSEDDLIFSPTQPETCNGSRHNTKLTSLTHSPVKEEKCDLVMVEKDTSCIANESSPINRCRKQLHFNEASEIDINKKNTEIVQQKNELESYLRSTSELKTYKPKKLTRLEKIKNKLMPKSKIKKPLKPLQKRLHLKPKLINSKGTVMSKPINHKDAYDKAVKIMSELKSKEKQKTKMIEQVDKKNLQKSSEVIIHGNVREVKLFARSKKNNQVEEIISKCTLPPKQNDTNIKILDNVLIKNLNNPVVNPCQNKTNVLLLNDKKNTDVIKTDGAVTDLLKPQTQQPSLAIINNNNQSPEITLKNESSSLRPKLTDSLISNEIISQLTITCDTRSDENLNYRLEAQKLFDENSYQEKETNTDRIDSQIFETAQRLNGSESENLIFYDTVTERNEPSDKTDQECSKEKVEALLRTKQHKSQRLGSKDFDDNIIPTYVEIDSLCMSPTTKNVIATRSRTKSTKSDDQSPRKALNADEFSTPTEKPEMEEAKNQCFQLESKTRKRRIRISQEKPVIECKRTLRSSVRQPSSDISVGDTSFNYAKLPTDAKKIQIASNRRSTRGFSESKNKTVVNYSDLDIFNENVDSSTNTKESIISHNVLEYDPKNSVLCAMIDKYGKPSTNFNSKKVPVAVISSMSKSIETEINIIAQLSPHEFEQGISNFINVIHGWSFKEFMGGLMHYLKDPQRKLELFKKLSSPPAPPMSRSEQILLSVLVQMRKTCPTIDIIDSTLSNMEYILFKLNHTPDFDTIESMAHLYAVICRYFNMKGRLRVFILDAMYCIQFKAVPLIKQCLDVWMHVLPLAHMGIAKSPLVTCMVYLLHFYKCEDRYNRVQEIRSLLNKKYHYEITQWNEPKILNMFRNAIKSLRPIPLEVKLLRMALIVIGKRHGAKWCHKNIVKNLLLPFIENKSTPDRVKVFCVSMLGPLLKPFPVDMKLHSEVVLNMLFDMLNQKLSHQLQEAVYSSLIYMSKHNFNRVVLFLLRWSPRHTSQELEKLMCDFVREKSIKAWKTSLSRITLQLH